jgi:hypothetical protein
VIREQPRLGIFTREQIDDAIRAANAILARRGTKKKSRSSVKKSPAHPRS